MAHWRCISGCGACCRLDPTLRGDDLDCLDPQQQRTYLSMVGEDGWCIHFDTGRRRCRIYDSRPDFCRVENLVKLFDANAATEPAAQVLPIHSGAADREVKTAAMAGGSPQDSTGAPPLDPAGQALAIASCRTQIRAEYGGRGRVMKRFEQAIRRTP